MIWTKKSKLISEQAHTIIGETAKLQGSINAKYIIRIDGEVKGDVECGNRVVIGKTGKVYGTIKSKQLDIAGVFEGNATIEVSINIQKTAKVDGELEMENISIEQGAIFNAKSVKRIKKDGISTVEKPTIDKNTIVDNSKKSD